MSRQKTWKEIEASRNRRLWITGVAIPIASIATSLYCCVPEVRNAVNNFPYNVKKKVAHLKNRIWK